MNNKEAQARIKINNLFESAGWRFFDEPSGSAKSDVLDFRLPPPSLQTQRSIVAEIEAEQALVNANRELVRRMKAKIKTTIDRVWGSANAC